MKENVNSDVSNDAYRYINNISNSCLNINNIFQKALSPHAMELRALITLM